MSRNPLLMLTGVGDLISLVKYTRALRAVEQMMHLDGAALERVREQRMRDMVTYAYENVEVYRSKWRAAGVHPDDIRTLADLCKLPIVTKDDFRHSLPDHIRSRQFRVRDCFVLSTSGSTGSPTRFYADEGRAMIDSALSLPKYMMAMPPVCAHSVIRDFLWRRDITFMSIVVPQEYLNHQLFWTMKHTVVNSLQPPDVHIRAINTKRPRYINTYPSVIRNVCIRAREKGVTLHRPRLILLAGEMIDKPLRSLIAQMLGADILDAYASTEIGYIASECARHEGMHVFSWKVILELLDDAGREVPAGRPGRVVITDLCSRATPIIRYAGLGDYAVSKGEPCSCGSPLPLLAQIEGRIVDTIVLPDGQMVHPYNLTLALEDIPGVGKFQIRQERSDALRVLLVKDKSPESENVSFAQDSSIGQSIIERFNRILRQQVKIELVTVDDIPTPPGSRKYPTVVSLVHRP